MDSLLVALVVAVAVLGLLITVVVRRARWPQARLAADGFQDMTIHVRGSYRPMGFVARAGVPLRLHFVRDEDNECSDRVFIPDFDVEKWLPAHRATTVKLMPENHGEFLFTCKNGIYIGLMRVRQRSPFWRLGGLGRLLGVPGRGARVRSTSEAPDGTRPTA